jgi:hypothetical protein
MRPWWGPALALALGPWARALASRPSLPGRLEPGPLLLVAGQRVPLGRVLDLVAPHFAVAVRGPGGALALNRTVPLPGCLYRGRGEGIQVQWLGVQA